MYTKPVLDEHELPRLYLFLGMVIARPHKAKEAYASMVGTNIEMSDDLVRAMRTIAELCMRFPGTDLSDGDYLALLASHLKSSKHPTDNLMGNVLAQNNFK